MLSVLWLRPKRNPNAPQRQPIARIIKVSLVFNYFTLLFLLELAIATWLDKAAIIAAQCVASLVASYVFISFLLPASEKFRAVFAAAPTGFDPTSFKDVAHAGMTAEGGADEFVLGPVY